MLSAFLKKNLGTILTSMGTVAVTVFMAAGFGFVTPSQTMNRLQATMAKHDSAQTVLDARQTAETQEMDKRHQAEIDTVTAKLNTTNTLLLAIARGQCLDRPPREWKLMGLRCNILLNR